MAPRERQKLQPRDTQRPNIGYDRAGPSQLERLLSNPQWNQGSDNTGLGIDPDILRNLQQAPGVIDHTIRDMQIPGEGVIKPENPQLPPWHPGNISDDSYWNVKYEPWTEHLFQDNVKDDPWQDLGVMALNNPYVNQMKDDYLGHRLFDSEWGPAVLGYWTNKFGGEGDAQRLEEGLAGLEDQRGWFWDFDVGKEDDGGWGAGLTGTYKW